MPISKAPGRRCPGTTWRGALAGLPHMMTSYRAAANIIHTGTSDDGLSIVEVAGGVIGFKRPGVQPIRVEKHRSLRRLLNISLIGKESFGMRVRSATIQDHLRIQPTIKPIASREHGSAITGPTHPCGIRAALPISRLWRGVAQGSQRTQPHIAAFGVIDEGARPVTIRERIPYINVNMLLPPVNRKSGNRGIQQGEFMKVQSPGHE